MAFRKSVVSFQKNTTQKLDDLNQLYQQESRRITDMIQQQAQLTRKAIAEEGEKTRHTITGEGQKTRGDVRYMASQVSGLSYEKGRLADAINEQTDRIAQEARRASYEQQEMFEKAREEARRQSERSRHCAEVLAKNGKYPWLSNCP